MKILRFNNYDNTPEPALMEVTIQDINGEMLKNVIARKRAINSSMERHITGASKNHFEQVEKRL